VRTCRSLADLQVGGDLLAALARSQEAQDLELTRRQLGVWPAALFFAERRCQAAGDCGIEREARLGGMSGRRWAAPSRLSSRM
jgi:hypothetical protein